MRLRHEEALGYDVWATAFQAGAPDDLRYAPEVPPIADDDAWEPAHAGDVAAMIRTALRILADDMLRIDGALEEAGATAAERAAHPLLAVITSLLLRSPVLELVGRRAPSDPYQR